MTLCTRVGALAGLLLLSSGCADLSMQTVDTEERVLSRRQRTVPNNTVRVAADVDGTRLTVRTTRGCNLVTTEEVERTEYLEAKENPTEEWTLFGLMSAPITSGIVLLVDAQNVHGTDRNSRLYNPVGPTGAYAGGGVLLGAGALLATIPFIELIRIATASEESTKTFKRDGTVLQREVPCDGPQSPIRASVSLRAGSTHVNRNTDNNGQLFIDLAEAIRPAVADQYENLEIHVANKLVDVIPMEIVREEQRRRRLRRDEEAWSRAKPEQCAAAPPTDRRACSGVRAYLQRFPNGQHADEARELLLRRKTLQIAGDPDAAEGTEPTPQPQDPVLKRAKERAAKACALSCRNSCAGKGARDAVRACADKCVAEVCK